jgi:hypothetical protein
LCCGTGLGYLIILQQRNNTIAEFDEIASRRIGGGHEIMAMHSDMDSDATVRIIIGTRDKRVQAWTLDSNNRLINTFSVELPTSVPRAVYFHGADAVVFSKYDGDM